MTLNAALYRPYIEDGRKYNKTSQAPHKQYVNKVVHFLVKEIVNANIFNLLNISQPDLKIKGC